MNETIHTYVKRALIMFAFFIIALTSKAQCNCETYDTGISTIINCPAEVIASDDLSEVKMHLTSADELIGLELLIDFYSGSADLKGNLIIILNNGSMLKPDLLDSEEKYIDGVKYTVGTYLLELYEMKEMMKSEISSVRFYLTDGYQRTYNINKNSNTLKKYLPCVTKFVDFKK